MTEEEWLALDTTDEKSKKGYAHFDHRTNMKEKVDFIREPQNIARHGFYPFIHYTKKQTKFSKANGKKTKERDICYAAHIDRCIYQYYSFLLGELYNQRVVRDGLSQVAVAYRTDLHQSNIDFARRAFDFIRANSPCYIMIGDFTKFFDHLDHKYLKQQWCSLMDVSELPKDHYQVFKSVTRFNTWELSDLLELNGLEDNRKGRRELNSKVSVLTPAEYKKYSNKEHIKQNPNAFGIPQCSPISGLLANMYMLEADKVINNLVVSRGGLYMRYSDDFIVVIPDTGITALQTLKDVLVRFNAVKGLTLQPDKTQYFRLDVEVLENCGAQFGTPEKVQKRLVDFLGFTFDGKKVSIRSKTTGKYYYRMYRKAKTVKKSRNKAKQVGTENLYALYSCKGARGYCIKGGKGRKRKGSGNYLSYVYRAKRTFGEGELIDRDSRRHMGKIKKAIS